MPRVPFVRRRKMCWTSGGALPRGLTQRNERNESVGSASGRVRQAPDLSGAWQTLPCSSQIAALSRVRHLRPVGSAQATWVRPQIPRSSDPRTH